jgi:hypothetical protein
LLNRDDDPQRRTSTALSGRTPTTADATPNLSPTYRSHNVKHEPELHTADATVVLTSR